MLEVEGEDNDKQGHGQVEPLQWSCDVTRDAGTDDCRSGGDGGNAATATVTATTTTTATGRRHCHQSADHGLVRRQPRSGAANNTNIGDIISYHVSGLPLHRALH
jgi:hypothetical protein